MAFRRGLAKPLCKGMTNAKKVPILVFVNGYGAIFETQYFPLTQCTAVVTAELYFAAAAAKVKGRNV